MSEGGQMVQRLATRPGADLATVHLRVEGADAVTADGEALRLSTAAGDAVLPLLRVGWVAGGRFASTVTRRTGLRRDRAFRRWIRYSPLPTRYSRCSRPTTPSDLLYGTFLGGGVRLRQGHRRGRGGRAYVTGSSSPPVFRPRRAPSTRLRRLLRRLRGQAQPDRQRLGLCHLPGRHHATLAMTMVAASPWTGRAAPT